MYPDLISRSLGFIGVFITLMTFGLLCEHNFQAQVQDTYSTLVVNINHVEQIKSQAKKNIEPQVETEKNTHIDTKNDQIEQKNDNEYQSDRETAKNSVIKHKTNVSENTPVKQVKPKKVETSKSKAVKEQSKKTVTTKKTDTVKKANLAAGNKKIKSENKVITKNETALSDESIVAANISRQTISNLIFDRIQDKIQYPQRAIKRKIQGVVLVEFNVVNGKIASFTIIKSSGHTILDKSAARLCKDIIGFDTRHPNSNIKIHMPIKYALI